MIGATVSHYQILERLGSGAMGIVYRARDQRLQRDVAIKVLPGVADDDARERFRTEALALSRLSHPNIATIFALEPAPDGDLLVMELVPGETLADRIASGPIPEAEVLELGVQIAEALAAAHEHGVIHRDLKAGNVLVTPRGQVKVLDFGLAKLRGSDRDTARSMSAADLVVGTPAYMAPEQLTGQKADARSDLFSLGVLLYEMGTGRRPHEERELIALLYAIVNTPPPPPRLLRAELSTGFERVVLRLLEKRPERRPESAARVTADLKALSETGRAGAYAAPQFESLAVLPLANLSGDPAQEFFADGMTEALITSLAQIGALRVISRTSAMRYKNTGQPLPEIGRELGVHAIVEGSVQRAGDRVRVSVRLTDATLDRLLWASSYESDATDVLGLQAEVARTVAGEVQVKITPREAARLARPKVADPRAHDAYLRGRDDWNRRTPTDLWKAIEHLRHALEVTPDYALAHAGLADAYNVLGDLGALLPREAAHQARAAIARALELDPDLGEAYTSMGFERLFYQWDWRGAREAFEHALELNPGYATGHQWYSEYLSAAGEHGRAIFEASHAHELDPLSPVLGSTLGDAYFFARRYEEAAAALRRTIEIDPGFTVAHNDLGRTLTQLGRYEEALARFEYAAQVSGNPPWGSIGWAYASAFAGRTEDARRALEHLESERARRFVSSYSIASIQIGLGDFDRALDGLERALAERDRALVWIRVHPRLDPLRGHPRFAPLAEAVTSGR